MLEPQTKLTEPHDDRWHYLEDRDERHEGNYVEWKYFNFVQKDLAGYVIYYVLDPERRTREGGGRLLVRILKDGQCYGFVKKVAMDRIELDSVSASMRMDSAKIIEHDSYHYEISGDCPEASWDLTYKQHAPSIESFQNIHSGLMLWERVNWLIKMPRAEVKGNIRIGDKNFPIYGLGYSDTNWGEMVPFFSRYEWGQYNDASFSLVFGILYKLGKIKFTYFYLIIGEHLVRLEGDACEAAHPKWKLDPVIGIKIPEESIFTARNGEYEVKFKTKLLWSDNPGMKVSPLLPKVVISEQIVEYEGTVSKGGFIVREFKGRGFQEWSGRTWKEIPVPF